MSDSQSQSALREWRAYIGRPQMAVILIAVSLFVTLAAPFGSGDLLAFAPRLLYWTAMVSLTFASGSLISFGLQRVLRDKDMLTRTLVVGLAISAVVLIIVSLVNLVTFGWWPNLREAPVFVGTLIGMTLLVTAAFQYLDMQRETAGDAAPPQPAATPSTDAPHAARPAILERIPLEKRGALLALSVEDHYVRIRTSKGEALVLMRLSDAMREVAPEPGLQVHRSHWVAIGAVAQVQRTGDRAVLTLSDETEVPVSRANIAKLRDVGLLPRT